MKSKAHSPGSARHTTGADGVTLQKCSRCQDWLPESAYSPAKWGQVGYCRSCRQAYDNARHASNPEAKKWREVLRLYGMTQADHAAMYEAQGGACATCHEHMDQPYVDHDHATGAVRQMLCMTCNFALGLAKDNPELLRTMATYLERHARRQADGVHGAPALHPALAGTDPSDV